MADKIKIIELNEDIMRSNDIDSDNLRKKLKDNGTLLINIMSSPGSGKTTLLKALINNLKNDYRIAVIEADIDGQIDASRILDMGVDCVQVHTGGCCHLTADMTEQGLRGLKDISNYDLIFLENVGNLVCPAEFDTGATLNFMLLSVPEGDDKALKYPVMFKVSTALIITKIDTLPVFNFDLEKLKKDVYSRNKNIDIFPVSAKNNEGIAEISAFIKEKIRLQKEH